LAFEQVSQQGLLWIQQGNASLALVAWQDMALAWRQFYAEYGVNPHSATALLRQSLAGLERKPDEQTVADQRHRRVLVILLRSCGWEDGLRGWMKPAHPGTSSISGMAAAPPAAPADDNRRELQHLLSEAYQAGFSAGWARRLEVNGAVLPDEAGAALSAESTWRHFQIQWLRNAKHATSPAAGLRDVSRALLSQLERVSRRRQTGRDTKRERIRGLPVEARMYVERRLYCQAEVLVADYPLPSALVPRLYQWITDNDQTLADQVLSQVRVIDHGGEQVLESVISALHHHEQWKSEQAPMDDQPLVRQAAILLVAHAVRRRLAPVAKSLTASEKGKDPSLLMQARLAHARTRVPKIASILERWISGVSPANSEETSRLESSQQKDKEDQRKTS